MAATQPDPSTSLTSLVRRFYPAGNEIPAVTSPSDSEATQISRAIFPSASYSDSEKAEVDQWLATSSQLASPGTEGKNTELLKSLNAHLSSRTTILGNKPSIADVALYSSLASHVRNWSAEERTGEQGYHHITRYVDFVQNAPLFGLSMKQDEKIAIDPNDVLFKIKPLDPKAEKERIKKEKAATAGGGGGADGATTLPAGRSKGAMEPKGKEDKAEGALASANDTVKDTAAQVASAAQKPKKEKAPKPPKTSAPAPVEKPLSPALIDLRVGHILRAVAHPNADSLYVSTIAVGDPAGTDNTSEHEGQVVRTVCSGLNGLVPLPEMQGRKVVVVCNLKPVKMRGVLSCAMVLAASPRPAEGETDGHAGPVELVEPPEGASAGERVAFEGWEGEPEGVLNPKKKVWETCQVGFITTPEREVAFDVARVEPLKGKTEGDERLALAKLKVGGGVCTVRSLTGAVVR